MIGRKPQMPNPDEAGPQRQLPRGTAERCRRCLGVFPWPELKRASVPTLLAVLIAGSVEADDSDPPDFSEPIDRSWYCSNCRPRVNRRRLAGLLLILAGSGALVFLLSLGIGN